MGAVTTTLIALGGLALSAKGQYDQKKAAKKAAKQQQEQQASLESELDAEKKREDKKKADIGLRSSLRSAAASSGIPKRSTILTSPLGLTDTPTTQTKTLLGS